MHTSGVVITVSANPIEAAAALHALQASGPLTLGESVGTRWAATLETRDSQAAHHWHDWASTLLGVESIEVVFVHWEEREFAHG